VAAEDRRVTDAQGRLFWGRTIVVVLAGGCYVASGAQAADSLLLRAPWDWSLIVGLAGGWALGMLGVATFIKLGGQRRNQDVTGAVDAGELPADARPEEWLPRLTRHVRELRQLRTAVVVLLGSTAVLVGVAAVATNDNSWAVWTLAVLLGAFIAVPFLWLWRRIRNARRLLDALGAEGAGA
jgi:hypothetical protein